MPGKGVARRTRAPAIALGVGLVRAQRGDQLPPHPLQRPRGRSAARSARCAAAPGSPSRFSVSICAETSTASRPAPKLEPRRQRLPRLGEARGVEIARALLEQRRPSGSTAPSRPAGSSAAPPWKLASMLRIGMRVLLVEPGGDAARRGDRHDGDLRPRRQRSAAAEKQRRGAGSSRRRLLLGGHQPAGHRRLGAEDRRAPPPARPPASPPAAGRGQAATSSSVRPGGERRARPGARAPAGGRGHRSRPRSIRVLIRSSCAGSGPSARKSRDQRVEPRLRLVEATPGFGTT